MPIDLTLLPMIGVPLGVAWIVFRMIRTSRTVDVASTGAVAQFRSLFGGLILIGAVLVLAWTLLPVPNRDLALAPVPVLVIALLATLYAHARALDVLQRRVSALEKRLEDSGRP